MSAFARGYSIVFSPKQVHLSFAKADSGSSMKFLRSPWTRLALLGLGGFLLILALQIPWDRSYRTASGIPRSYAPFGDEIRRSDGSVDYRATLNRLMGETPPPEKNAVAIYAIYVARDELTVGEWRTAFFKAIGLSEADFAGGKAFYEEYKLAEKSCQDASTYIWKSDQDHPEMAEWLDHHSNEIAKLREASQYQWYSPFITIDPTGHLIDDRLLIAQSARRGARMLLCNSFREAGRGNLDRAVADVAAAYQIGLRIALPNFLSELGAAAVRAIGLHAGGKLLQHGELNESQLKVLADCFHDGGESSRFLPEKIRGERYNLLDILQGIERKELTADALVGLTQADSLGRFIISLGYGSFVDRGSVLQELNQSFDSIGQYRELTKLQGADLWERLSLLDSETRGKSGVAKGSRQSGSQASYWAGILFSPTQRGKRFGEVVWGMAFPAFKALAQSEIRLSQTRGMLQLAIALEQHERRHGAYPSSLDQLVPEFLSVLPIDHFAETGTFGYQRLEHGFRISLGKVVPEKLSRWAENLTDFVIDRSEKPAVETEQ